MPREPKIKEVEVDTRVREDDTDSDGEFELPPFLRNRNYQ